MSRTTLVQSNLEDKIHTYFTSLSLPHGKWSTFINHFFAKFHAACVEDGITPDVDNMDRTMKVLKRLRFPKSSTKKKEGK